MTKNPSFTMRFRRSSFVLGISVGVILTAVALELGILTQPFATGPVLIYFLAPVVFVTWLSGARAGLLTLALDFLAAWYVLVEPRHSLGQGTSEDWIRLSSLLIVGGVIIYVISRLRAAEQRQRELSTIVEFSDDAIVRQTLDGIITTWNRGAERLYGYTANEALGRPLSILNPSETPEELRANLKRLSQGEYIQHYEASRKCKDGRLVDVEVKISPVFDDTGKVSGASRLAHDVTARKQAQDALRESEQRLQLLIEHAPAGLAMFDREMHYLYASERWRSDYGIGNRDLRGVSHYELFPEIPDRWKDAHRLGLAGKVVGSESDRFDRADGSTQWVRWQIRPWRDQAGAVGGIVIFAEEITDREQAHQRLRESERRLKLAITATADAVWEWKLKTGETYYSPRWYEMLGYTNEQLPMSFDAWKSLCHPDDVQPALDQARRALTTGTEYRAEFRMRHKDGSWRWILGRGNVVERDPSGEPVLMSGTNSDITAQKRTEELRRESEQRFRAMAENIPQMVWVADAQGGFRYLSPKWLDYTGMTPKQNVNGGWIEAVHPDDRITVEAVWTRATETGSSYETEYRLRRIDGQYRWHLARGVPLYDANTNETLWFGTTTDIEDQKRATNALIRSEKLASVGRMAATVAHEINNPLAAALNAIYIARTSGELHEQATSVLVMAEQELIRASQITRQTLGFYRESTEPKPLNVADVLNQILDLYHNKVRNKNIRIERRFKEEVRAFAVEGEVRQVLSNLIANAIDAVPAGGTIRLRVSGTNSNGTRMVRITIADNGTGISPDNKNRIFEPFFTTKESYGTGLGLWITRELLTKQCGRIKVRSSVGKGTTFSVWLPMQTHVAQDRTAA